MLFFDLMVFVTIVFGASSFGVSGLSLLALWGRATSCDAFILADIHSPRGCSAGRLSDQER